MKDPRRLTLYFLLLIIASGFLCYANTLNGPFLFDDYENILSNGHLRIHHLSPAALADAAFKSPLPSRPIANISFALNYLAHGYWLPGYHLTNISIHCLTGIFLFFIIKITFATPALGQLFPPEKATRIAGISTLLWLLNPANTQSVSYLVQRMNSLSAMFFLLSVLLYLKARSSESHRPGYFAGCLLSGALALGSKEIAATLPPTIFIYEWYFFQNLDRGWLKKKLPMLGVAAVVVIMIGWLYPGRNFSSVLAGYQSRDFTVWQRLMTEPRVVCRYLALVFFPYPGLLNLDHDYPLSTALLQPPTTILAMLALAALFLLAIFTARRHRFFSYAILWFFLNLLIESSIIPLEIIFDHRAYLPGTLLWPPLLAVVWQLPAPPKKIALTAVIALLTLFAVWTFQRNQLWADEVAINRDIVLKSPDKARAHCNLGLALINSPQGPAEEGVRELRYAIGLEPNSAIAYLNLGGYYLKNRRYDEAVATFKMVTSSMPDHDKVHYPLSLAYLEKKEYPAALAAAGMALTVPGYREKALQTLGIASAETGDFATAVNSFRELSELYPTNWRYRFNLGRAWEKAGENQAALQQYAEALALAPEPDRRPIQHTLNNLRNKIHH